MDKTLKIKISVDKDTGAVSVVGREFNGLSEKVKETDNSVSAFGTKLKTLAAGAVSVYALKEAFMAVASSGIEFNKNTENLKNSLTTLAVATSGNVTTTGVVIDQTKKYALAAGEASEAMERLAAINADTPHTLSQTVEIYKSMYSSMKMSGVSTDQMVELTKKVSIAAGSAGVEFQQLLAGVDGLAKGQVEANSEFGRFLANMGLTNAALKNSKDIYKTINDALVDIKGGFGSFDEAMSNAQNSFSKLAGSLTEPLFDELKKGLNESVGLFDTWTKKINDARIAAIPINQIKNTTEASIKIADLAGQIVKSQDELNKNDGVLWFGLDNRRIAIIKNKIKELQGDVDHLTTGAIKDFESASSTGSLVTKETKEDEDALKLKKSFYDEVKKLDNDSNTFFLDGLAKEALAVYQHYEDLKEKYKDVAGAKGNLGTLQDKALVDIEAKYKLDALKKAEDDKAKTLEKHKKLEENFVDDINALVDKKNSYFLDGLTKEALETYTHYENLIAKYSEVAGAEEALRNLQGSALNDVNVKIDEQNKMLERNALLESITESTNAMQDMLDMQIALSESGKDWASGLSGQSAALSEVGNSFKKFYVDRLKLEKSDIKFQEDYAKAFISAKGDEQKEKVALSDFDAKQAVLREQEMDSYIGAFGSLSGAVSNYASQSDNASKTAQAAEKGLAVVQAVRAVIRAWGDPFPLNLITVPATVAATGALLSSIGKSGGGSGGVPVTSTGFTFDQNRDLTEAKYTPITDLLKRQVELLESIDRQGSASQLGIGLAATTFKKEASLWIEDVLEKARQGLVSAGMNATQTAAVDLQGQQTYGIDIWQTQGTKIGYNADVLREGTNLIKTLVTMSEQITPTSGYSGTLYQSAALEAGYNWQNMLTFIDAEIERDINEYQNLASEWSLSVIDSMSDLKDAAKDFKGFYDDITGSMFYETQRLNEAFADVDKLRGGASFADYLKTSIEDIQALETFFTEETFALLMSNNKEDIEAQIAAVEELGKVTGETFDGGAREALNYLESIELVAEAMAKSRENIKSFTDSLLSDDQLAKNLASSLGVSLATSVDGLAALFYNLSEDMDGLTDSDLDLLNANKALLENTDAYQTQIDDLNITLDDASDGISTLEGALGTITSTVDKLRGASKTSERSLQDFYDAMADAQALSLSDQYEEYANAIKRVTDASSVLFDISTFQTTPDMDMLSAQRDMEFNQLVAANQFERLQDVTLKEVDYLEKIEVNTANTASALVAAMNSLSINISNSLAASLAASKSVLPKGMEDTGFTVDPSVQYAYSTILGREAETAGASYWETQVSSGAINPTNLTTAIGVAALPELYSTLLGRAPDPEGLAYWTEQLTSGAVQAEQIDDLFKQSNEYKTIHAFADGGLVKGGMGGTIGLIGEKDYDEVILPLKNPDDPLSMGMLVKEIRDLKNQVAMLLKESNKNQAQISKNTAASRYES